MNCIVIIRLIRTQPGMHFLASLTRSKQPLKTVDSYEIISCYYISTGENADFYV